MLKGLKLLKPVINMNLAKTPLLKKSVQITSTPFRTWIPGQVRRTNLEKAPTISKKLLIQKQAGAHLEHYEVGKVLGKGAFGEVRIVTDKRSGKDRAAKYIATKGLSRGEIHNIKNEIGLLAEIDHPNVMRVHEWYQEDNQLVIITQLCTGGDLWDTFEERGKMGEVETADILKHILGALNYCHK